MPEPGVRVKWSKRERDLVVSWDAESSGANPRYIVGLFTREVMEELDRRGYDTTTLKFSIRKKTKIEGA